MSQDNPPTLSGVWSGSHLKLSLPVVRQQGLWINFACRKHWVLYAMDITAGTLGYGLTVGGSSC